MDTKNRAHLDLIEQPFIEKDLDYSALEEYKPVIKELAINNGYAFIVDMFKFECMFLMTNYPELYGIDPSLMPESVKMSYMESRVHPEDKTYLWALHNQLIHFLQSQPIEERMDYKYIANMRVKNTEGVYKHVIIQYRVLELDCHGNIWLILCTEDLSPEQFERVNCVLINYKTGQTITVDSSDEEPLKLSPREKQVLKMIKEGLISKEIADNLNVSIRTVIRHRQNIFEKIKARNSHDAIKIATKMGVFNE